jgi:hypothetical protein
VQTVITIKHPNGDVIELKAEKFILAFKEEESSPLSCHVKMLTDEILAASARISHMALKNEESLYASKEIKDD